MSRYRKKPSVIEAEPVSNIVYNMTCSWHSLPKWVIDAYESGIIVAINENGFIIKTLEGDMKAGITDMLVKGIKNELYACRIDIFEELHERVE